MSHTPVTSVAHKPLLSLTLGAKEGDAGEARNASCLFSVLTCSAANDLSLSSKIERMWAMRGALPSRRLADKIGEEGDCFPRMTASKIQLPYSPNEPQRVRLVIVSIQKRAVYSTYHQVLWQTNLSSVFTKPPKLHCWTTNCNTGMSKKMNTLRGCLWKNPAALYSTKQSETPPKIRGYIYVWGVIILL